VICKRCPAELRVPAAFPRGGKTMNSVIFPLRETNPCCPTRIQFSTHLPVQLVRWSRCFINHSTNRPTAKEVPKFKLSTFRKNYRKHILSSHTALPKLSSLLFTLFPRLFSQYFSANLSGRLHISCRLTTEMIKMEQFF
jgi:hypothetical protein